ncbi:MAG: zinc-binding dehydrogenase [Ignavibacteriae bacterium]|nr:zinc-binding dehydrogenase [Ignavibacteriota bacterium]
MKAIRFHEYGNVDVLRYEDAPTPTISPTEVLINLKAAALNHLDLWVRSGARERNIPLPHIGGSDGAGIIAEVGTAVTNVKVGDRVVISPGLGCGNCAMCLDGKDNLCSSYHVLGTKEDGTYAEYVNVPANNVVTLPSSISFEGAAAASLVFLTAWHMLVTLAKVRLGETVLVHGAGSGVGSAAIQIAKLFGAHVITTAGTDEKLAKAKQLGADEFINYKEKDFVEELRRLTEKRGVDIVFEHIGGEVFEKSILIIKKGGRLVTCGATGEFVGKLDLRYLYSRHITLLGSFMGTKSELFEVMKFLGTKLHPVIDSVFPLSEAKEAQQRMEERKNFGKIILFP